MPCSIRALFLLSVFALNAFSQTADMDTAKVPVIVNVAATVSILPPAGYEDGVGDMRTLMANKTDTLVIILGKTQASYISQKQANSSVLVKSFAGKIFLDLPTPLYKNAEISLYKLNGKRVLYSKASIYNAANTISSSDIPVGAYLLSVAGVNGNSFTARYVHSGGKLNINVTFGGENAKSASPLRKEGDNAVAWTITATATASGYTPVSYEFSPEKGTNPVQNITLVPSQNDVGFVPEELGIGVGATTSEVRFAWYSDTGSVNNKSFVRIFNASNNNIVSTDSGEARAASPTKKLYHKVAVGNLTPNTEYKYSVSNNKTDWSRKYNFKTPGTGAFSFAAAGDMHQGYVPEQDNNNNNNVGRERAIDGWKLTMEKIAARNVNFVASVGDHIDTAKIDELYKPFFDPPQMQSIPFAVAMGNHDIDSLFVYHFNLPNTTDKKLILSYSPFKWYGSYWYLYNNALFVVLNTGAYLIQSDKLKEAQNHVVYFDTIMTRAKNAHAGKYDWLIVQHHKSTQSVGAHALDEEIQLFKQAGFETLMDEHKVDLVFAGHDHIYVRTKPMKDGRAVTSGGTVYLTLPTASYTKFYPETESLAKKDYVAKYKTNNWRGWPGYAIFNVNGKNISTKIYNYDDKGGADVALDSLSLSK
ncbi:MAG: fibronectin type III domain-containing protein [Fibromonadaceae bacterium]|nr:fibronectin type III domain-containing protein [Fibromonadaceae bacterium]